MYVGRAESLAMVVGILIISGIGDSLGFIHAAKMWQGEKLVWSELSASLLGFAVGIGTYLLALRYLKEFAVLAPEVQTLIWFGVTIIGVAAISGKLLRWHTTDQIVALCVLLGIGWLMFRSGD